METVVQTPPAEAELHLLTDWGEIGAAGRRRKAAIGTVLVHIVFIFLLMVLPASVIVSPDLPVHEVTPLVMPLEPPAQLTQKAANHGKVMAEFQVQPSAPRPRLQAPVAPVPQPRQIPRPAVIPQAPAPKTNAPAPLPDAPPAVATVKPQVRTDLPALGQVPPPPPQIQTEEPPKLTLENAPRRTQPAAPTGRVPMPSSSIGDIVQGMMHGPGAGGPVRVGDDGAFDNTIFGGPNSPPAPGMQGAGLELKSDPMGVDFKPYLQAILAVVRRNWMAVLPESARMGMRGKVALQIAIIRDGSVARLVYAERSGTHALDEAAVAGVSASNPLPPLPPEFHGERIVVQFNFVYNMPRR
jgi:TonB family protein